MKSYICTATIGDEIYTFEATGANGIVSATKDFTDYLIWQRGDEVVLNEATKLIIEYKECEL